MEVLGYPVKSPLDDNLYKVVKLSNGIRALMITELQVRPGHDRYIGDETCMDIAVNKFNRDVLKHFNEFQCDCYKDTRKPTREIQTGEFGHGLMATVGWTFGVGSFTDPDCAPGLAHLSQRMLTLGSGKYPGSYDFLKFISDNNGEFKAVTEGECTTFRMKIYNDVLEEALDRMAQFLIAPIINRDQIPIQRSIIHSEFKTTSKMDDEVRRLRLLQLIGRKNHPVTRFYQGNKMSLRGRDRDDENMTNLLYDFKRFYYGAEHMTIAIQAGFPFKQLEAMVQRTCGNIPKSNISRSDFSNKPLPFRTLEFRKLYKVVPIKDETSLFITWELKSIGRGSYVAKTLEYISRLLVHAACGGLASYLRYRLWITDIDAGVGTHFLERNDCCTMFTIKLLLTEEGLNNYPRILEITFQYLKYLRTVEPCAWRFTEFQDLRSVEFHMKNNPELTDDVCTLANRIRICDAEDILHMGTLVTEWEPEKILGYLRRLTPQKANFMIFSNTFKELSKREPLFGIKYDVEDLPKAFMSKLRRIRVAKKLYFEDPCRNPYIATNFCKIVEDLPRSLEDGPECVFERSRVQFWNEFEDNPVGLAEASYRITLCSSIQHRFPPQTALLDLWIQILRANVIPQVKFGTEAGLYFEMERSNLGVDMEFGGLIHKLDLFIEHIFDRVRRICKETNKDRFEFHKEAQLQKYQEELRTPAILSTRLKDFILTKTGYMPQELYAGLKDVTLEQFRTFCKQFSESLIIIGLAEGNVNPSGTINLAIDLMIRLKMDRKLKPHLPAVDVRELPLGDSIVRIPRATDEADKSIDENTSAVANVYQIEIHNLRNMVIAHILARWLYAPATEYLLRVEKIGHAIDIDWSLNASSLEFHIGVLSNSKKFTASQVKAKIDYFVVNVYDTSILDMEEENFMKLRTMEGWEKFGYFETNNWREIMTGDLMFDRDRKLRDIAYGLDVEDIKRFYETYLLPRCDKIRAYRSHMRKLSIQIVGPADKEYCVKTNQFPHSEAPTPESDRPKKVARRKYPFISLTPAEPEQPVVEISEKEKAKKEKFLQFNRVVKDFRLFRGRAPFLPRKNYPGKRAD